MPALHDFYCEPCDSYFEDIGEWSDGLQQIADVPCRKCKGMAQRVYLPKRHVASAHYSEKVVVFEGHDARGKPVYEFTLSKDDPLPPDLKKEGYVRRELGTLQEIRQVEKATGRPWLKGEYDSKWSLPRRVK